ncbi:MAG: hypothetical protein JEZ12_22630 [Desulfobacterium sp.]|nr:hypothetical protein [Desulfobacterium sp.]
MGLIIIFLFNFCFYKNQGFYKNEKIRTSAPHGVSMERSWFAQGAIMTSFPLNNRRERLYDVRKIFLERGIDAKKQVAYYNDSIDAVCIACFGVQGFPVCSPG